MPGRIQLVAILASTAMLGVVLEMVRRRRLMERYALVWLLSAVVLLGLASWRGGLRVISHALGIAYAPNALFFVAVAFILLLLLHFSAAVSRLGDQTKVLAQRAALLEERLRRLESEDRPSVEGAATHQHAQGEPARQRDLAASQELTAISRD